MFRNLLCHIATEMNPSKFHPSAVAILSHVPDMDLLHRHEPSIRQQTLPVVPVTKDLAVFCRILPCIVSVVLRVLYMRSHVSMRRARLLKVRRVICAAFRPKMINYEYSGMRSTR